jgi:hypothetical protein
MEISQDEHERARLRSRRKAETDRYSDMATSELRGELRANRKNALAMIAEGMGVDVISRITGLTVDDILRLK